MAASTPPSCCSTASRRSTSWARRRSNCGAAASAPRALEADLAAQRAGAGRCQPRRPTPTGTPACPAFTRGNMAEAARRFELVADAPPDQASSWTLSAGSFWAARANLLAGNPQKFAPYLKRAALHGRTFYGLIAQKALGMQDRAGLERAARSIARRETTCCATTAPAAARLALLQLGAATAAERELFAGSIDADPQFIEAVTGARPEGVAARLCRRGSATPTGTSATTSRAMTARSIRCRHGSRPAATRSTARWSGASCARNRRSIPRRAPMSAPWA